MTQDALTRTAMDVLDAYTGEMPTINLDPAKLNWHHGAIAGAIKVPGVFYGVETAFIEPPHAPWVADERFLDTDGLGYSAPVLRLAFIGQRDQWFIPGATGTKEKPIWLPNGSRAPEGVNVKKQIDYLVLVDGLNDPMVLSVSGQNKSRPIEDILRAYERGALSQLIRQRKKATPRWAHWLTIGGRVDPNGKPIIEKAKNAAGEEFGSEVTPPILRAAPILIDADRMTQGIETWNLYNSLGWFKFQRTNQGDTVETMPQLTSGRNVPQPISAADLPPFEGAPDF